MLNIKYAMVVFLITSMGICTLEAQQRGNRRPPQNRNNTLRSNMAEAEKAVLSYLEQFDTDIVDELAQLKSRRPRLYRRQIEKLFTEMNRIENVKESDKAHYNNLLEEKRLELKSRQISRQYRRSDVEAERQALALKLEDLIDRSFDLRQKNRLREIEKLEQRVVELKSENKKRLQNKATIVAQRLKQLKGDDQLMQW